MSWFENAQSYGNPAGFHKVEKDLNTLIKDLVVKHLTPILGKNGVVREHEYELWGNMKRHLKGDGKKISLVIKDYFDGMEKVIKRNKEVMGSIFYGYARSKRMTDNAWDEQIVNNIKIKKIHVIQVKGYEDDEMVYHDDVKGVGNWPIKEWDYSSELEIYTRAVVKKEIGK